MSEDSKTADIVERLKIYADERFFARPLILDAMAEIERLSDALKEADAAIRELQQEACNRAGVPMPSQRSVVDRQRDEIERLRAASPSPRAIKAAKRIIAVENGATWASVAEDYTNCVIVARALLVLDKAESES